MCSVPGEILRTFPMLLYSLTRVLVLVSKNRVPCSLPGRFLQKHYCNTSKLLIQFLGT